MRARATPGACWQLTGSKARPHPGPRPPGPQATQRHTRGSDRRRAAPGPDQIRGSQPRPSQRVAGEREGIDIGRTTLRRILAKAGMSSPRRRRPPKHRVRRQRMPREGMLIQLDGSHHRWLGDGRPPFALLLAVDDATAGEVVNARFWDQEDSHHYLLLMRGLLRRYGIPLGLYTDRHPVFKHRAEYQPAGAPTQFGRAMGELGIQLIFALSPQAKGRVERTAGTFQDRLITELRLAGATTIEQAKAVLKQFLPRFNRRFRVPAQCPDRHSGPCRRVYAWSKSCALSTAEEWPGATP